MGDFDLDPASNDFAQETVCAGRFFTAETNGLDKVWHGRIWLNPPYAQPLIEQFVDKLIAEVASGTVTSAIMLTNNSADTHWFQKAARAAAAMCFTDGRIRFVSPTKELSCPTQGQTFFYFGNNPDRFAREFEEIGLVLAPYRYGSANAA
jgi:phage N-6-adenine-methyltransferase